MPSLQLLPRRKPDAEVAGEAGVDAEEAAVAKEADEPASGARVKL